MNVISSKFWALLSFCFLILLVFLFYAEMNYNQSKTRNIIPQAGVVLSFDDDYVAEWQMADDYLKNYHWKATFFISKINKIKYPQLIQLLKFQQNGHEIAGHGWLHTKAPLYLKNHSITSYMNLEILPMQNFFRQNNLKLHSFSYPYGERNEILDKNLYQKFKILRGTTYASFEPERQNCYNDYASRLVLGWGIDDFYPQFSITYLEKLLAFAKKNNKILILYAHKPVKAVKGKYEVDLKTLVYICQYVQKNNMKFYTFKDLN